MLLAPCKGSLAHLFHCNVFRIVATCPKRRKTHVSPTNQLRADHIAVAIYEVDGGQSDPATLSITPDAQTSIQLMSMETLVPMGLDLLRQGILKCKFTAHGHWHFSGRPLPSCCHSTRAWELIIAIVDAGAQEGNESFWTAPLELPAQDAQILNVLIDNGLLGKRNMNL